MSKKTVRTDLMLLEAMFLHRFRTVGIFKTKIGRKGYFRRKNREVSLWSLHVLVTPSILGALISKMMDRIDPMLLGGIFPNGFQTTGLSQPKNGQKGNFLRKNTEFSLWSVLVVVSPGVEGAVMFKMMGQTDPMLLEAMFTNRFQTADLCQPKHGYKGIFEGKTGNFLCGAFMFLFHRALRVL